MLVQLDGSHHAWLEDRGPRLVLIAALDDATGEVLAATFRDVEDAHGYLLVLRTIALSKGLPLAIYSDRPGIFHRDRRTPPLASIGQSAFLRGGCNSDMSLRAGTALRELSLSEQMLGAGRGI